MRKKLCVLLACMLCMSTVVGCKKEETKTDGVVWGDFATQLNGYVYELYNFDVPTVTGADGKELKVKVSVADKAGKLLDTMGGFFVIRAEEDYTITYSVEYNGKTYTKTATVTGIYKTDYTLNTIPLYGVGERVDLTKHVTSSLEGEMEYSVQKEGKSVAVAENAFTPDEVGTYNVTASMEKQPDFEYSVTVVDKNLYPYPNGLITDGKDASAFTATIEKYTYNEQLRDESSLTENGSVTVSHSTDTYYGEGNGSTKISVDYPQTSKSFVCDIAYKPEFALEYYQSLQLSGYENIAVRMRVEHSNPNLENEYNLYSLYPFKEGNTKMDISVLNTDGESVFTKNSYLAWSNDLEQANGEWVEMLLPISQFIAHYKAEGMTLFKYVTLGEFAQGSKIFDNMYGTLDIYIDNVYAVKALDAENADLTEKELNDTYLLDNVSVGTDTVDFDKTIDSIKVNGKQVTPQDGKITLSENGVYSITRRARNRYGVAKTKVAVANTGNIPSMLQEFTSANGLTANIPCEERPFLAPAGSVEITYDQTQGAIKTQTDRQTKNIYFDLFIQTAWSKETFEYIRSKTEEYQYVTVKVGIPTTPSSIFLSTGEATHRNDFGASSSGVWLYDGTTFSQTSKINNWSSGVQWVELSVDIDDFIANMDGNKAKLFRLFTAGSDITLYFDSVYLTKEGKKQ